MTEMQQILAGMNELNETVQKDEARATEAERQAPATQQEFARSQVGVKGKERGCRSAITTGARDWRVCVEAPASAVRRRGRQVERMGSSFSQMVLTIFLVVRWQKFTNTLRGAP